MLLLIGCEQKSEANEKKLLKFLDNLQGVEYEIRDYVDDFEGYQVDKDNFTQEFYNDFLKGRVKFVVPKYRTDDIDDSRLQEYLSKYPKFKFGRGQIIGDEEDFIIVNKKYPHYNFKFYQLDFDNDNANGLEDIFYSGGYWNDEEDGYSSYVILNKKNTDIINPYADTKASMGGVLVQPEYEGKDKKRTKDYTGIIRYRDRYYIYEVWDWDTMVIIKFYTWNKKTKKCLTFLKYTIDLEVN